MSVTLFYSVNECIVTMCTLCIRMYTDYSVDGRGNVDRDSDEEDGGQPEAFNPEYESIPVLRPAQPPMYKPTPSYPHGGEWYRL